MIDNESVYLLVVIPLRVIVSSHAFSLELESRKNEYGGGEHPAIFIFPSNQERGGEPLRNGVEM
jgi:hypothetical protein